MNMMMMNVGMLCVMNDGKGCINKVTRGNSMGEGGREDGVEECLDGGG